MSRIILQPTSNSAALKHFKSTIKSPVDLNRIQTYIDPIVFAEIKKIYPTGKAYVWGVTNGTTGSNEKKVKNISKGDVTLFSRKGGIFASAVTTMTFKSEPLAKALWGVDPSGNTWENIYLVEEIQSIDIPYCRLNPILGYKDNYIIQGFNVLNEELSNKLFAAFDLSSATYCEEISTDEYDAAIGKLESEDNLNTSAFTNGRKEQSFLRNYLFKGSKTAKCGICGKEYPVDMLITSHIKKRSECTKEEKLDYKHIVMPMCKFGCDDMYEKGYIYIENEEVKINPKKVTTSDMNIELLKLKERKCTYYNPESEKYFEQHRKKFGI